MVLNESILVVVDAVLSLAAVCLAVVMRLGGEVFFQQLHDMEFLYALFVFTIAMLFSSHLMDVYDLEKNVRISEIIINILFCAITSFSILSVIYYVSPGIMLGRGILLWALFFFSFMQFCWHTLFLAGSKTTRFSRRVLILGTGRLALQIGELALRGKKSFSFAGYASCVTGVSRVGNGADDATCVPLDKVVGGADELITTARRVNADLIVVALTERRGSFPLADVLKCKLSGLQVMDAPSFYEAIQGKLMLEAITPSWFIFSSGFRRTTFLSIFKRCVDITLSIVGLLLTLPLFPFIAFLIKMDSPGPIFFRQQRVGNKEKLFMLYKFRTMRQDAEAVTGAKWAEKNDPRITRIGAVLRGSRIDELPQLVNVLRGEMSFIGPRPERPEFVEKLKQVIPYYSKRHFICPGLTGWAQVRYPYGSSIEDAVEKLRYDLYYIKNICPFLDTLIFFETIKVVLFGRGGR